MTSPTDPLQRLKRAAARRDTAERDLRSAVVAAAADGLTFAQIGRVLGISRAGARQMVARLTRRP